MKFTGMIALSALAMSLAACGNKTDNAQPTGTATEVGMSDSSMAGGGMSEAAMASPGQIFADTAASSDAFEIATSKMAAEKASASKLKTFAQQMIKAHTESTAKLKTAAAAASPAITPAPAMNAMQQATLDELKSKTGAEFDTAYKAAQVDGHQKTLDALKAYAATGDVPSLKAMATEMVPTVTGHFNMAKGL